MAAPTMNQVAKVLLRDRGVISFDPASPATQSTVIQTGDTDDIATIMTMTFQEIADEENSEPKTQPGSAVLFAPTQVTLDVTQGSTTIANLTTFASWMPGCTIRISSDTQDNELRSSTKLARPYIGSTSTGISATVYCDAITLDETIGQVIGPMMLRDNYIVEEMTDRRSFIVNGGYPVQNYDGYGPAYWGLPFYAIAQKPDGVRPLVFFLDGNYDPTLDYIPRRIRLSPMPNCLQSLAWTSVINPLRVTAADIDNVGHTDPGVKIPMPNGWVESLFLPIARQIGTGFPRFNNESLRPEIFRQYGVALKRLHGTNASVASAQACWVGNVPNR